ncbi:hypothetical protein MS3_00001344 [Schistosoma haematobium]|uniref:Uncharacterized protein n=1 Tax=Schistosoma haematobium TaxID=6185 RepID=A0A922LCE2_SCHHA|nr:uncharacterized protein MS3_00001344 [Schistosoma haematobium]KAH9578551.1 hypothetical protein MS3_00001344 [Schistosoma haematobium]
MSVCKEDSDDPTLKYFFVSYVCTYGRKRSSSESDACVQDVDDDSNNHSSEEHTTSNSPTQPRKRGRRRSSTYALLQMSLSFRSKYCVSMTTCCPVVIFCMHILKVCVFLYLYKFCRLIST